MSILITPPKPVIELDDENDIYAKGHLCAEMSPWTDNKAGVSFGVTIVTLLRSAVDVVASDRLKLGEQYLLEIPRCGKEPLKELCTVTGTGRWKIRAEFETPLTDDDHQELESRLHGNRPIRITSRRTQHLFILFGIVGLVTALLMDWH